MKRIALFILVTVMAFPLAAQINFREGGFSKALEAAKVNWCLWIVTPVGVVLAN